MTNLFNRHNLLKLLLAALSIACYTTLISWQFGVLLMLSIGWHEEGHLMAARYLGKRTGGFYFLPLLGGISLILEPYDTYAENCFVAMAGPIAGAALALFTYVAYLVFHTPWLAAATCWMAIVNLFNLIPVGFLDGGQMLRAFTGSIHPSLRTLFLYLSFGFSVFVAVATFTKVPILAVIAGLSALSVYRDLRAQSFVIHPLPLTRREGITYVLNYVGTICFLLGLLLLTIHIPDASIAEIFFTRH